MKLVTLSVLPLLLAAAPLMRSKGAPQNACCCPSSADVQPVSTATVSAPAIVPAEPQNPDETQQTDEPQQEDGEWIQLFDGQSLKGWTPKIRHHELGDNYGNTFRVEDGLLKVRYDREAYETFDERFGHLFYEKPFSHYRLRVEYRFVGEQCPGGPGWALRNSGLMLHGEDPKLMDVDQDFPTSIEYQTLGGDGQNSRSTGNLCTPGTNVQVEGELFTPHCTSSSSDTYHGEQWVTAEVEVRGSKEIKHYVNGELVLQYQKPQLDPRDDHAKMLAEKQGGLLLEQGTISLQSESHPVDYRKVELMILEPGES